MSVPAEPQLHYIGNFSLSTVSTRLYLRFLCPVLLPHQSFDSVWKL